MPTLKQIEGTVETILRNAVARGVVGEDALAMSVAQRDEKIAHLQGNIEGSMGMLRECLEQASLAGANSVHAALHSQPGVDPFMLDEAVEHAPTGEDG
jgi:hypothetical protein